MYQEATSCPFPIYADPTKKLYDTLGMTRTLSLGSRPDYQRRGLITVTMQSIWQELKQMRSGKALQGGDLHQVGGEFLFEPVNMNTPISSPAVVEEGKDEEKQLGESNGHVQLEGGLGSQSGLAEEKRVTWCHRMRNTRDHAEIPELREVLGLYGTLGKGNHKRRWSRALLERKGSGVSSTARMGGVSEEGGSGSGSGRQSSEVLMNGSAMQ